MSSDIYSFDILSIDISFCLRYFVFRYLPVDILPLRYYATVIFCLRSFHFAFLLSIFCHFDIFCWTFCDSIHCFSICYPEPAFHKARGCVNCHQMDVPDRRQTFGVVDYCVFGGTLLMSLMIGVFYAFRGKHTNEEMLLGNRQLRVLPVAISVMVSFISGILILGKRIPA